MRYLYGDSAPFPYGFDFLATLARFLEEACKVVRADSEGRARREATAVTVERRRAELAALELLHVDITQRLEEGAMRLAGELAPDYAGRVREAASRSIDEAHRTATSRSDMDEQSLARELARLAEDSRTALEAFFVLGRLPILAATLTMELVEGHPTMSADLLHPEGIAASFALATDLVPDWQAPRRAGDFHADLEMTVGLRRGLFSRGERLEPVHLDEFVVGGFTFAEERAEIRLRRKVNEPDQYVLDARMEQGSLIAEVSRPLETGERAEPIVVEEADRRRVLALWESMRRAANAPLERRARLLGLSIDRDDVFATGREMDLLERLVRTLAHTALEVARRSPNPEELSLKRESDSGDREELYVKKRDLWMRLAPLTLEERALFMPLALSG